MEPCTPEKVAAQSRYRRYFPPLPADVRADVCARMRELVEEERDALQLRDLAAQLLGRLGVLGGLCHPRLQGRDLLVALGDSLLPVGAAHLRLLLRRLLLPEVFLGLRLFLRLVAMVITGHVSHLSCRGRQNSSAP